MEIVVIDSSTYIIKRTYFEDYNVFLNPKYFNQFDKLIITKTCFKKTHNKHYTLQRIPIKNNNETHKVYNIYENCYQTLLTKLGNFNFVTQKITNAKHDRFDNNGLMMIKNQYINVVTHYYAKLISQIFRYKYHGRNFDHIEKLIQEFLY